MSKGNPESESKIEKRISDIALKSSDPVLLEASWIRILTMKTSINAAWNEYIQRSLELILLNYRQSATRENVKRLTRMLDLLSPHSENTSILQDYRFFVLNALQNESEFEEVVRRSEPLLQPAIRHKRITEIIQMNVDSRLRLMGFDHTGAFETNEKLKASEKELAEFFERVDLFKKTAPKFQHAKVTLQAAKVELLRGKSERALAGFLLGLSASSNDSESTRRAPKFAVAKMKHVNSQEDLDKILRDLIEKSIIPEGMNREKLVSLASQTIYFNATQFLAQGKNDEAAVRFVFVTERFSASPMYPDTLERAGFSFTQSKRLDKAIPFYESYLKQNIPDKKHIETEWILAEIQSQLKDYSKAALSYHKFRLKYLDEGRRLRAAEQAGRSFRFARSYREALEEFEFQFSKDKDPQTRLNIFTQVFETGVEAKNKKAQIRGLEGLTQIENDKQRLTWIWFQLSMLYQEEQLAASARRAAERALVVNDNSESTLNYRAQSQQYLGLFALAEFKQSLSSAEKNNYTLGTILELTKRYEKLKVEVLAPCEAKGAVGCSKGLLAIVELATEIIAHTRKLSAPKYYQAELVTEIETERVVLNDKLTADISSFSQRITEIEATQKELTIEKTARIQRHLENRTTQSDDAGGI